MHLKAKIDGQGMADQKLLQKFINSNILEAYKHTFRIVNISVSLEHILELIHQHFEIPGLSSVIKKAHAMLSQTYSGDITIYPERHLHNIGKIFTNPDPVQFEQLILEGRRATWPKIERIRNTTQISRTFDNCLQRMSERFIYVER